MKIVQATNDNLTELMSFYSVMCDVLGEKSFLPNGDKGVDCLKGNDIPVNFLLNPNFSVCQSGIVFIVNHL